MELKNKIKKVLLEERNRKLEESFSILKDIRDKDFFMNRCTVISNNLIEKGYSKNEIIEQIKRETPEIFK